MSTAVDQLLTAPILVTGTPRSGKTLTASILARANGMVFVNEPILAWAVGATKRPDDRRFPEEATPDAVRKIRSLCAGAVRKAGGSRYLDDLAYHGLRIDFVRAVMPDALIVHLVQDGYAAIPQMVNGWTFTEPFYNTIRRRWRGVNPYTAIRTLPRLARRWMVNHWASKVEGRRRAWGPQPPGLAEFARQHADPAEIAAFQWKALIETALDDLGRLPEDQAMTIRFEDLIDDTKAVVARLARFCRIDDVDRLQQAAAEILVPGSGKKGVELSTDQWKRVERIVRPLRERLGYTSGIPTAA